VESFQSRYGLVPFRQYGVNRSHYVLGACECCAHSLVADHCHVHQWIRGVLCRACNAKMRQVDVNGFRNASARAISHWLKCPDCLATFKPNGPESVKAFREAIRRFER
jgi:hypothetical protein